MKLKHNRSCLYIIITFIFLVLSINEMEAKKKQHMFYLRGTVYDSFTGAGIKDVKAYLMDADSVILDSVTARYGRYNRGGTNGYDAVFSFYTSQQKPNDVRIVKIVHKDYYTVFHSQSLKHVGKQQAFDMPKIFMKRKNSFTERMLDEVEITATKVKVFYKGDTIVYNADAFNVADGSMLDALIKQMPGVELDKQGQIFVNGRKIDNLLLNGKDFFKGNSKLMLENLPYFTVKDIKVYNKTKDKAMALHDDMAKKDFVMDVYLKKEYSKGYLFNVEAGAGTEGSYLGRLFGLRFTDFSRFAIVGGTNNLNMRDYSSDGNWSESGSREGRTTSKLLTAELLTEKKKYKNVLTMEATHSKSVNGMDEYQETYHSNNASTFSVNRSSSDVKNLNVSASNHFTLKLPVWIESITSLRYANNNNATNELYCNSDSNMWHDRRTVILDSLFKAGVSINDPSLRNARNRMNERNTKKYTVSQNFAFAKNIFTGDIIDFNTGVNYKKNDGDANRRNVYLTFNPAYIKDEVMELINNPSTYLGVDANLSYKIKRLFPNTELSLYAKYQYDHINDNESITDVVTSMADLINSYERHVNDNNYAVGMRYGYNFRNKDNVSTQIDINIPVSFKYLKTNYNRFTLDTCLVQSHCFVEPTLSFQKEKWPRGYAANPIRSVKISSSFKYTLPNALQLVTLPVTSDKINIFSGNSDLKPSAVWTSSIESYLPTKQEMAYLFQNLSYRMYIDRIVNTYRYNAGVYTHTPENINGTWDIDYIFKGQHFIKIAEHGMRLNWDFNANYSEMSNFVADGLNGKSKRVDNNELYLSFSPKINTIFADRYFLDLTGSIDWRKPLNNQLYAGYTDTWTYQFGLGFRTEIFAKIDFDTDFSIIKRNGFVNNELNHAMCEWDMSLSRSFMNDKICLKLKAVDILQQYKNVAYMTNEQGIRETHAIVLPGYVLFTASYRFNKQPKKK